MYNRLKRDIRSENQEKLLIYLIRRQYLTLCKYHGYFRLQIGIKIKKFFIFFLRKFNYTFVAKIRDKYVVTNFSTFMNISGL